MAKLDEWFENQSKRLTTEEPAWADEESEKDWNQLFEKLDQYRGELERLYQERRK